MATLTTNRLRNALLEDYADAVDLAVERLLGPVRRWERALSRWRTRPTARRALREVRAGMRVRECAGALGDVVHDWRRVLGIGLEELSGRLPPCRLMAAGAAITIDCLWLAVERGEDVPPSAWADAGRVLRLWARACEEEACRGR